MAKANMAWRWRGRLALAAAASLVLGTYFFYDALIGYPSGQQRFETYSRLADQNQLNRWPQLARENGWKPTKPSEVSDADIVTQYICGVICLLLGVPATGFFIASQFRYIASDEQGLHTFGGKHVPWDSITGLHTARWKTKGIAKVSYDKGGTRGTLTLDDWKYEQEPTQQIFQQIKKQLGMIDQEQDPSGSDPGGREEGDPHPHEEEAGPREPTGEPVEHEVEPGTPLGEDPPPSQRQL